MWEKIQDWCRQAYITFHDSETLLWARLKIAIGALWVGVSGTDLSPIIQNPKIMAYWMVADGAISEYLRRRNAEWNK